jgi:hypothetical protein
MEVIFCMHLLSDVVLPEGVPSWVTRVSNNVIPLVFPTFILHL